MKKLFKIIFCLICIIFIKLVLTFIINGIIIKDYNNQVYDDSLIKTLYVLNFNESYIPYYNHGNILYKTGDYEEAINKYNTALEKFPSKKRVCDIRINLSLSILATIDINSKDALILLEEAKENLYQDNCVDPNYKNSKSKTAEELEKQIKKMVKEVNKIDTTKESNNKDDNDDQYSHIEKEIIEKEKSANENRQQELNEYENMTDFEYYSGKRW